MPIFVYECSKCQTETEWLSLGAEDVLKCCPSCGSKKVSKALTAGALHFKGGGWADDGYGSVAPEPDRGAKEAKLRREVKERAYDHQAKNDAVAAEHGLVRSKGPLQKVEFFPERPIE